MTEAEFETLTRGSRCWVRVGNYVYPAVCVEPPDAGAVKVTYNWYAATGAILQTFVQPVTLGFCHANELNAHEENLKALEQAAWVNIRRLQQLRGVQPVAS
jgi:hypothetical protein